MAISKTVPIHKKGNNKDIENYRPIANLCSTSKILEKFILKRIILLKCTGFQRGNADGILLS